MTYFLGIDSSTTATKALLMDGDGSIVGIGRSDYAFETPRPLWSEQSPNLWWEATITAINQCLDAAGVSGTSVAGIGLTGQMHGLVMLDNRGEVLRPAILWNDQRTEVECDQIRDAVGRKRLIEVTGNDALTGFTAPKVLWVRNNEPEVFDATATVLLPKDYVRFRITGEYAMDKAGGSGTILFDLGMRDWSDEVVRALDLDPSWLPETFEGTAVTGGVGREASELTGIPVGTPVMGGAGDQAAAAVGVGAIAPGVLGMSVGTSGVVFGSVDHPAYEPDGRLHAFCHAFPDMWHLMGVMLSAAGSYQWFKDSLAPDRTFAELEAAAASVVAGADGLIFLPYLSGERTPHPDALARGAFVGLTVRHGLDHMARSVMEGVAFGLRDSVEMMRIAGSVGEIRISGGGASSDLWLSIIADVVGRPVGVVGTTEAAAHGAGLLAAVGTGAFSSVGDAVGAAVSTTRTVYPTTDAPIYEETYEIYRELYPSLRSQFHRLGSVGNR